MATEKHILQAP